MMKRGGGGGGDGGDGDGDVAQSFKQSQLSTAIPSRTSLDLSSLPSLNGSTIRMKRPELPLARSRTARWAISLPQELRSGQRSPGRTDRLGS